MKRLRFCYFINFSQNTDIQMSGKSVKLHDWPKLGNQLLVQWTTSYLLSYQGLSSYSSSSLSSTSKSTDLSNYSKKKWERYQIQSRLEVTSMHAGNRCWQILISRPRETMDQLLFFYKMKKEDATQGILVRLQPFTVNPADLETHVHAHSSERAISNSEGDVSKVEI